MVDERGSLTLPLTIATALVVLFALGTWGVMRNWRSLAEAQLKIDRCAGETAIELRTALRRVKVLNQTMNVERKALAAATLLPPAAAAARALLQATYLAQEGLILHWNAKRGIWLMRQGCESGGRARPLPALPWSRDPPDTLGPKPLRWTGAKELRIQLSRGPRHSAALVEGDEKNVSIISGGGASDWPSDWPSDWKVLWTRPLPFWAGSP